MMDPMDCMDSTDLYLSSRSRSIDFSDYGEVLRCLKSLISSRYVLEKVEEIMRELKNPQYVLDFLMQYRRHNRIEHRMFIEFLQRVIMDYHSEKAWHFLQQENKNSEMDMHEYMMSQGDKGVAFIRKVIFKENLPEDQLLSILKKSLLYISNAKAFQEHIVFLESYQTRCEIANFLAENLDHWNNDDPKFWNFFWEWGAKELDGFIEKLIQYIASSYGSPWHYLLHKIVFYSEYGLPSCQKEKIISSFKEGIWKEENDRSLTMDMTIDRTVFSLRKELQLSENMIKRLLVNSTFENNESAEDALEIMIANPDEPILRSLSKGILNRCGAKYRLKAYKEFSPDLLPETSIILSDLRKISIEQHDIKAKNKKKYSIESIWKKILEERGYLIKKESRSTDVPLSSGKNALFLFASISSTIGQQFLYFFDPIPASDIMAIFPWLQYQLHDGKQGVCSWIIASMIGNSETRPPSSLLEFSPYGWNWEESFAISLPLKALPTLFGIESSLEKKAGKRA
ncbi:MAG: hypothetical protein HUU50_21780 [Candidatus Brocadiae bacterium]|nr:hypothetical protein [Candidatus Brocadiia bacterium]